MLAQKSPILLSRVLINRCFDNLPCPSKIPVENNFLVLNSICYLNFKIFVAHSMTIGILNYGKIKLVSKYVMCFTTRYSICKKLVSESWCKEST